MGEEYSVEALEEAAGLDRDPEEEVRDFIVRVGRHFGLDADDINDVCAICQKATAGEELTRYEEFRLEWFFEKVAEERRASAGHPSTAVATRSSGVGTGGTVLDGSSGHALVGAARDHLVSWTERFAATWTVERTFLATVLLVAGYVFFLDLGSYPLRNFDEAIYASAARLTVEDGYWAVPRIYYLVNTVDIALQPRIGKPPLVIWLQSLAMLAFGVGEFAVRFPSATAAFLTSALVYVLTRTINGKRAGLLAGVVFVTAPQVYAGNNAARLGATDMVLLVTGTTMVALLWLGLRRDRTDLLLGAGVAAGLAVLTKGVAAGIFVIIAAPLVLANFRSLVSRVGGRAVIGALLVAAPWLLYAWSRLGELFVDKFLLIPLFSRATGTGISTAENALFPFMNYPYFTNLPTLFDPWVYLLVPAVAWTVVGSRLAGEHRRFRASLFLTWWVAGVIGFYAYTGNHVWYIMPIYVPAAVLVGWTLAGATRGRRGAQAATALGAAGAVLFSFRLQSLSPFALERGHGLLGTFNGGWLFVATLLCGAAVVLAFPLLKRRVSEALSKEEVTLAAHILPVACACLFVVAMVGSPPLLVTGGRDYQQMELGTTVDEKLPEGATVHVVDNATRENPLFSFAFYADRPFDSTTVSAVNRGEVRYVLLSDESLREVTVNYSVVGGYDNPLFQNVTVINATGG